MSMQDPIADMLTRIRNGQNVKLNTVSFGFSKLKEEILNVLKNEGYILDYVVMMDEKQFKHITVSLKYYRGSPVIHRIKRISRPGLRQYTNAEDVGNVPGFGIKILTTSKGVMTHQQAKKMHIGGEIICEVA